MKSDSRDYGVDDLHESRDVLEVCRESVDESRFLSLFVSGCECVLDRVDQTSDGQLERGEVETEQIEDRLNFYLDLFAADAREIHKEFAVRKVDADFCVFVCRLVLLVVEVHFDFEFKRVKHARACDFYLGDFSEVTGVRIKETEFFKVYSYADFNEETVVDSGVEKHAESEVVEERTDRERTVRLCRNEVLAAKAYDRKCRCQHA